MLEGISFLPMCTCPPRTLAEMAAATSVHVVAIVEPIIQHADWFFPEGRFCGCPLSCVILKFHVLF